VEQGITCDFLLEHGAAAKVNRVEDLLSRIGELLGSKKLASLAHAARSLGRPTAAEAVCQEALRRIPGE
jgi:UDP-N-acetylglucosamine:LPS N-acetylglucosamine transferase